MSVFSFKFRDIYQFSDLEDKEYELICWEHNKLIDVYAIKTELFSTNVWNYISEKFKITNEDNIMTYTEIEMDEKNKRHKLYKYIVKCELNNNNKIYLAFNDELRGYGDEDYHGYVTEKDKSNKIYNLNIYYDSDILPTKDLEDTIIKDLMDCSYIPTTKNQFFTISTNQFGFTLKSSYVKEMNIDLELNYGKKFLPIYEEILNKLQNEHHGLFLFHGEPGTGKTTFLRHLISTLSEGKSIIYVPSYMMSNIADPEFISFLGGIKNVILLLEDAENVLSTSVSDRSQAVSNILNMTDGLLNDYMDIQIIATFNTNAKVIDPALKRAGRLQVDHKFNKLSAKDANILAETIGIEPNFNEPVTLAEIYEGTNQIISDDLEEKRIGF